MTTPTRVDLAIIGGTGVYRLAQLEGAERHAVETPFGEPSAAISVGRWGPRRVAFLARHGDNHGLLPHQVNYRANVWALSRFAPKRVVAINAVGSVNPDLAPGSLVLPHQIIDYTWGRAQTYATELPEVDLHIDFTEPYSASLRSELIAAGNGGLAATEAVLGVTQGPRLESAAEVRRLANDGCDLVGMTSMPEVALARELRLEYAGVAIVSNWGAGLSVDGAPISHDEVIVMVEAAGEKVLALLRRLMDSD